MCKTPRVGALRGGDIRGHATRTEAEGRDIRAAWTTLGIAVVVACSLWGLGTLYLRGTEDRSWAEGRCTDVPAESLVNLGERGACIRRELAKNPIEIVWPQMLGTAAGVVLLVVARRYSADVEAT